MVSLSKTVRALCLGVALVSFMIGGAGYLLLREIQSPVMASDDAEVVEFIVEEGDTTNTIATNLGSAGLIRQPLIFTTLVRMQGLDGQLQTGNYLLRPNMTMSEIMSALQVSIVMEDIQIQTIEGMRLEEMAEIVGQAGLPQVTEEAFLAAAQDGALFQEQYFLLQDLPSGASLEGYLFPDTYRVASTATVTDVIGVMLNRFVEQYSEVETQVQVEDVTIHDLVTMASIVQREAALQDEMPQISAVFWNRLKEENLDETGGGKLQADPTLQYAIGESGEWWPKLDTLTIDEINGVDDPYNTRVNSGLPPGPISNPGLNALLAAARPDESAPYLYFVASCPEDGSHRFATTFAEFEQYEDEYLQCVQSQDG
ncbi:MAG: endolytic transglycosylase MltG [Chloroflexi bacterium AL-W]|nr:endolytic transglycosylase MltG [Chloroflexi bacterium AL-N1]NOK68180.1 endolytic transglycosylase MltG [Chloroflexi bacterium AL-N10]NOK73520.1 endolytic transglycosylase MltG [Chloroflexi bacterium AL-N5]NOK84046.1 endolytic transglycosylase MltG [Chloroflexi bacterium AL-W]NOK87851.1 endolytic transglycosylase MltG [Chloroflexi bacterium AL-N15]